MYHAIIIMVTVWFQARGICFFDNAWIHNQCTWQNLAFVDFCFTNRLVISTTTSENMRLIISYVSPSQREPTGSSPLCRLRIKFRVSTHTDKFHVSQWSNVDVLFSSSFDIHVRRIHHYWFGVTRVWCNSLLTSRINLAINVYQFTKNVGFVETGRPSSVLFEQI